MSGDALRRPGEAGRELAASVLVRHRAGELRSPYVLALPRGGVPVAAEVARRWTRPGRGRGAQDRRPVQPGAGVGALAGEAPPLFDTRALESLGLSADGLGDLVAAERAELRRREQVYRAGRPAPVLGGRTAVLVDDGLATGVTARAAVRAVRAMEPAAVVLAAPVCSGRRPGRCGRRSTNW
ncbi:phosphoribosyltransferase family protein [Streptomyces zhihengii]